MFCLRHLLAGAVACFAAAQTPPAPSVILISIDTLRADHLSSYGYRRMQTPNIDGFAQGGTLFTNIEAQIPLTLPSHTSLFTSTYPFRNRIEENAERVPSGAATLASILKAHGYKTAAFIGSVFLEQQLGLDQGFDVYDSPFSFEAFSPFSGSMFLGDNRANTSAREKRDAALVVRAANRWLAANHDHPLFAFVHLFDLHKPYDPHLAFHATPGISGYDAQLEYIDHVLGSFKKTLVESGWWDRSLVVVLSDHGESLGEHGEDSHGVFIYQSTVWVPLLVHWPAGQQRLPAKVAEPAGLIDVAPTILDFLHIPAPSFEGRTLLQQGEDSQGVYAESLHTHDSFGWSPLRSVRMGSYKYINAPRPELYDLRLDPHEANNLYRKNSPLAADLASQLKKLLARYPPQPDSGPGEISPRTRATLGSLGYLAPGPQPLTESSGPDPKDRMAEFKLYEKSQLALYYKHTSEAVKDLQELLRNDPRNTLALRDLGAAYLAQRAYAKARDCFERVLANVPQDYMSQFELGVAEEHLGTWKEALQHLETACRIAPHAVECQRELAAARQKINQAAP